MVKNKRDIDQCGLIKGKYIIINKKINYFIQWILYSVIQEVVYGQKINKEIYR